jgi:hypothetical protein
LKKKKKKKNNENPKQYIPVAFSSLEDLLRHYKERFLDRENYLLLYEERTLKVYI